MMFTRWAADTMTLAHGLAGFSAVVVLALDMPGGLDGALGLLALAIALDGLDGPVARRYGSTGLGATLDTGADSISFGALPGLLVAWTLRGTPWSVIGFLTGIAIVAACLLRLALNERAAGPTFRGVPSPWSAAVVGSVVLAGPAPLVLVLTGWAMIGLNLAPAPTPRSLGRFAPIAVVLAFVAVATGAALLFDAAPGVPRWLPAACAIAVVAGALLVGARSGRPPRRQAHAV